MMRRSTRGDVFSAEALELHGICAGIDRDIDEPLRQRQVTVVIHAGFRDHEARSALTDREAADLHQCLTNRSPTTFLCVGFMMRSGERPNTVELPGTIASITIAP